MPDLTTTRGRGLGSPRLRHGRRRTRRRRRADGLRQLHHHRAAAPGGPRLLRQGRGWPVRGRRRPRSGRVAPHEHERRRALLHPPRHVRHVPAHRGRAPAPGRGRASARSTGPTSPWPTARACSSPSCRPPCSGPRPRCEPARRAEQPARTRFEPPVGAGERALLGGDPGRAPPGAVVQVVATVVVFFHGRCARTAAPPGRSVAGSKLGHASVHAAVVEHRPELAGAAFAQGEPFCIALVDLQEGVRMMTNVVGCPPEDVSIGMALTVTWEPLSDGRQLPLFRPAGPPAGSAPDLGRIGGRKRGGVVSIPDDKLAAAAEGMLLAWWAAKDPGSPGARHRPRGPHLRRSQRRHQPAVPRAAGPGPAARRRRRPDVHQRARSSWRCSTPRSARGLRLTPINWHLTGEEAGYIVDNCEAKALRLLGRARRQGRRRRGGGRPGPGQDRTRAATSPASRCTTSVVAAEDGSDITDPVMGTQMLYTSGTTGRPKGVHRDSAAVSALAAVNFCGYDEEYETSVDAHLLHRPALPRRPAGLLGGGAPSSTACRW